MTDQVLDLPARDIAITLMKSALMLLDHADEGVAAAALQNAIDTIEEGQTAEPA